MGEGGNGISEVMGTTRKSRNFANIAKYFATEKSTKRWGPESRGWNHNKFIKLLFIIYYVKSHCNYCIKR